MPCLMSSLIRMADMQNPAAPAIPPEVFVARLKVSLRQKALYLPSVHASSTPSGADGAPASGGEKGGIWSKVLKPETVVLVHNLRKLGFVLSEPALRGVDKLDEAGQKLVVETLKDVMGVGKNWLPLVKGWNVPTGESILDHLITWFANILGMGGTTLPCGHVIPPGTFPLERYNGCPFCGQPFETATLDLKEQGSTPRELALWDDDKLNGFLSDLLQSKTPLDASQVDSLQLLLPGLPLPEVPIQMKETVVVVADALVACGREADAGRLFQTPQDILRYLWFKHTGHKLLVEPKAAVRRASHNQAHISRKLDRKKEGARLAKDKLKLKYSRPEGLRVARWLNALPLSVAELAENMHPKREMWVRFIRALRLAEHSHRPELERLKGLLDVFYRGGYPVWAGKLEKAFQRKDATEAFRLLKARPGMFSRSLLATLLTFGPELTLQQFEPVALKVPMRLLFSVVMFAEISLDRGGQRLVRPLAGEPKAISTNPKVKQFSDEQLLSMIEQLKALCVRVASARYATQSSPVKRIYIEPKLFHMPIAISDRSDTVQDLPVSLMGTRFPLESAQLRLFMQWGTGLPAQHMDMDLSCRVIYEKTEKVCYFGNLVTTGCKHSGDVRANPGPMGTAEYVEMDVNTLAEDKALYAVFTCNAYSNGALTPNLMVGWMSSAYPMEISAETGVAYDPSCVQQQVRITAGLTKGLVFGVLDVANREVIWLELPFAGQVTQQLNLRAVRLLLTRLENKLSIGALLTLRAEALGQSIVDADQAEERYESAWAQNAAGVTRLLLGA